METWLQVVLTGVFSFVASSGLWGYMQHKDKVKGATIRLLMGMAYDQITTRGVTYIARGWVTKDEYEEFQKFFVEPYVALGGNGVAQGIASRVSTLDIVPHDRYESILRNHQREEFTNNVRIVSRDQQASSG